MSSFQLRTKRAAKPGFHNSLGLIALPLAAGLECLPDGAAIIIVKGKSLGGHGGFCIEESGSLAKERRRVSHVKQATERPVSCCKKIRMTH